MTNHKCGFADIIVNSHLNRQILQMWVLFYLFSCFSVQFLCRTAIKATFSNKDIEYVIIKNSITLYINITTFLTKIVKLVAKPHLLIVIFLSILQHFFINVYSILRISVHFYWSLRRFEFFFNEFINYYLFIRIQLIPR